MISSLGEVDICPACVRTRGKLCDRCKPTVVPQLKQSSWYRHAHSGLWTDEKELDATMDREAQKVMRRKARRAARRRQLAEALGLLDAPAAA